MSGIYCSNLLAQVESKKNYDNTTTVKVTKQSDAYENPQIIQPKTDVYAFPVYNPPNMSGFLDAGIRRIDIEKYVLKKK